MAISIVLIGYHYQEAQKAQAPIFITARTSTIPTENGLPVRIMVPDIRIDIPIALGNYDPTKKTWNISNKAAYFATVTTPPNTVSGTTLLYAHNSKNLFGPTVDIQPGNQATVVTAGGAKFIYTYTGENVVAPTDTDVFNKASTTSHQLILLTCSGSWNQKRRLLYFEFTKALL